MDLIRDILLFVESNKANRAEITTDEPPEQFQQFDRPTLEAHINLAAQHGLVEACTPTYGNVWVIELTWAGFDYLDKTR